MAQVQIRDEHGRPIPSINVRLSLGSEPSDQAYDDRFTDLAGNTAWPNPLPSNNGYTLYTNVANVNGAYLPQTTRITNFDNDVQIVLKRTPLQRLHVGPNRRLYRADGSPIFVKGNTDLLMYKRFLDWKLRGGPSIEPLLEERASLGSECISTFGMVVNYQVPLHLAADVRFVPAEYGPAYIDLIPVFADLLNNNFSMYWYHIVFADTEDVMPILSEQINFFLAVEDRLKLCDNVIGNLNNEPYAHTNAVTNPWAFPRPFANVWCAGSFNDRYGSQLPPWPRWDIHDYHTPRNHNRVADCCVERNPNYEAGQPVACNEGDKYGGPNEYNPKIYRQDADECRRMRDTAEGSACMFLVHTSAGNYSIPFNEIERNCVKAALDH